MRHAVLALILLTLAAIAPTAASADAAGAPRLLADSVDPGHAVGRWWGLCSTANGTVLSPVNAIAQPSFLVQPNGGKVDQPTLRIEGCKSLIVALRNLPFLRKRSVPSARVHEQQLGDDTRYASDFAGTHVVLESHRDAEWRCALHLEASAQTLRSMSEEAGFYCELVWVGDLDGDGRVDLVVDTVEGRYPARVLFLSSEAKAGELVHAVASTPVDQS